MTRDFRDHLEDMLEYAQKARTFLGPMTWEEFRKDERTVFAVIRAIEVIGEAARNVPGPFRDRFPDIPWQNIVGMRNVLAHDYIGANPRVIYDTATIFLPDLIAKLPACIAAAEEKK